MTSETHQLDFTEFSFKNVTNNSHRKTTLFGGEVSTEDKTQKYLDSLSVKC